MNKIKLKKCPFCGCTPIITGIEPNKKLEMIHKPGCFLRGAYGSENTGYMRLQLHGNLIAWNKRMGEKN